MKPKKHLGQNFLRDNDVLEKIIASADLTTDDLVIEIGPGEGVLTEKLLKKAKKVIAIEIDNELAEKLQEKFKNHKNLEIVNADILKINLPEIIEYHGSSTPKMGVELPYSYKVIANIPYYITSPIIQLFLETKHLPREMILMVQREVAERICAKPGDMSILALSVQYYAQPELLFYVDKNSFWPVPEVDSAVIKIIPLNLTSPAYWQAGNLSSYQGEGSKRFFRVVRAGFASKRKTLLNNLANSFHLGKTETEEKIKKAGINPGVRAQELSIDDWKKLSVIFIQ